MLTCLNERAKVTVINAKAAKPVAGRSYLKHGRIVGNLSLLPSRSGEIRMISDLDSSLLHSG